jgi:hypothetical protein
MNGFLGSDSVMSGFSARMGSTRWERPTNAIGGFSSPRKNGITGVNRYCSTKYLHHHVDEYALRHDYSKGADPRKLDTPQLWS